jgi:hypothetical protein
MLLFNPGRVADGLRSGDLSEHAKARLLVWSIVLSLFLSRTSVLSYRNWAQRVVALLFYGLFLGGVWSCYRLNARLDNRRFVERYVCLSIPLWGWTMLGYLAIYYVAFPAMRSSRGASAAPYPAHAGLLVLSYGVVTMPIYFVLLHRYFRRATSEPTAS